MEQSKKGKRKQWLDKDMISAMKAVQDGEENVTSAAKKFNVPRRTLDDRIKGRVTHGTNPGRTPVLTKEEEGALVTYLLYMAERGFPLTPKMCMAFAWAVAIRAGKEQYFSDTGPTMHWWVNFRKRHPQLTLRKVDKLERSRAECLSPEVVKEYFDLLKKTLDENGITTSPRQIYNCDETFLPLDETREKGIFSKKSKCAYIQSTGTTDHITVLCGASAAGSALPPMIIYPKAFPGGQYRFGGPDDALYARSDSGWVDSELFFQWFKKIFLKFAVQQRPLLLIVDGHKSHITLDLVDLARENDVVLFCLPPHTTHALQPLDVSVFKSLKNHFTKNLRAVCFSRKDFVVSKRDFARVVKEPFETAFSMSIIKKGFSKCGIFPFNPNAVDTVKMQPSTMHQDSQSSAESTTQSSEAESSISTVLAEESSAGTVGSELSDQFTPPLFSTPTSSSANSSTCTRVSTTPPATTPKRSPIVNPLVSAGLIPSNLGDIFAPPPSSASKPKRRIVKARVLTEDEFANLLKEKDRKEKEAAEDKERRKIEREQKRQKAAEEKEKKKIEQERKKQERERRKDEKGKGKQKKRTSQKKVPSPSPSLSPVTSGDEDLGPGPSKRSKSRSVRMPSRYRTEEDEDSSGNESDTICARCEKRDLEVDNDGPVFWIDCDSCSVWYHTYCVFGKNVTIMSRRFLCEDCV